MYIHELFIPSKWLDVNLCDTLLDAPQNALYTTEGREEKNTIHNKKTQEIFNEKLGKINKKNVFARSSN